MAAVSLIVRADLSILERSLEILMDQRVAWMSAADVPSICQQSASDVPQNSGFVQGQGQGQGQGQVNTIASDDAEIVYQAYPRKIAKQPALKAITKALKTTPLTQILDHLKLYSESVKGKETTFIPHCATYFNGGRHLDPVEIITKPSLFDITGKSVNL